jgi:AAA domain
LPADLDLLEQAIVRTDARLVVIDPVMAFLDQSVMVNSDQSVRRTLAPLARLARIHRCAVLLVRHLNKQGGFHALYRGGGSIGLLAACRSGWLIGRDPHVPERRILAQVKNNLAGPQPSLAYELRP